VSGVSTEIIRSAEALEALEPRWWSLWRRAPEATPFGSPAWLLPWWRAFHPGELFTAAAYRDGELVGLAPFYREDGPHGRRLLPVGISLSDHHDVLLDPACAGAAAAALTAAVESDPWWEAWSLEELPPEAAALRLPVPEGCRDALDDQSACPVLPLRSSVEASLPKSKFRNLILARNRAARREGVRFEEADAASLPTLLDGLFRLHGLRWESRGEAGVLADDPVRRFHRKAAPRLLEVGLLRLHGLRFGADLVAAHYGFRHGARFYTYLQGFDPTFAFESPGALVAVHAMEGAARDGARELHFLRGREPYKYEWGAADRWNRRRVFTRVRE
jgi:CelD/BcsL family acetyltransferase involved in cellulose biosynthesis